MPSKIKLPILTIFVPEFCANCKHPYDEDHYKYTLVGTENRCVWLCNPCFLRLHADALEREKPLRVDVKLEHKATVTAVKNGKTLFENVDRGAEQ